jgi:hypothetical protein
MNKDNINIIEENYKILHNYKLDEVNRAQMTKIRDEIVSKDLMCPICMKKIEKPVFDHAHTKKTKLSGSLRSVICSNCNVFIAKIENNASRYCISREELYNVLKNVADYFEYTDSIPSNVLHPDERQKVPNLGKREYNKIKKYYLKVYPRSKKIPEYPKSGKKTQKWVNILNDVLEYESTNK